MNLLVTKVLVLIFDKNFREEEQKWLLLNLPYSCTCCTPPQNKLGGTRLKFFNAPKNFYGFRTVHENTRLKLCHLFRGGGVQQEHDYGKF